MPCPFCREEIHCGAAKCKHCGEFLNRQFVPNVMASCPIRPEAPAVRPIEAPALPYRWGTFQAYANLVMAAIFSLGTVVAACDSHLPSPGLRIFLLFFGGVFSAWLFFLGWGLLKRYPWGLTLMWISLGLSILFAIGYLGGASRETLGPRLAGFLAQCGYIALHVVYYRKRRSLFRQSASEDRQ